MKLRYILIALTVCNMSFAQNNTEKLEVKKVINSFFHSFHKQDTVRMKKFLNDKVILQSIGTNQTNQVELKNSDFTDFLKSIASIPKTMKFEEKLLSYDIKVDGNMANVWTQYEFYVNDKFSHKGVNSFELIKKDEKWKIFYLVDTRRQ